MCLLAYGSRKLIAKPPGPSPVSCAVISAVCSALGKKCQPIGSCHPRVKIPSFSADCLCPSPTSGARAVQFSRYRPGNAFPIRRQTLTSFSPPHGRRRFSWDRGPYFRAATNGHDIHHSSTFASTISNHRPRYRSRERPLRRTRPSFVEGRRGEGVVGIRGQLSHSNVGRRRRQPVLS